MGVGIDVGARRLHAVAVAHATRGGGEARVVRAAVLDAGDLVAAVRWIVDVGASRVAVDAPSDLSTAPHADDRTLAPKFRVARCGEIALGREAGVWVPWVSPRLDATDVAPWIGVGLALFASLAAAGVDAVETFPHACFRAWAGGPVPPKSRVEGLARRAELLSGAGLGEATLPLWSHDGLDAAAAALVAVSPAPRRLTCGHDDSAIWLPQSVLCT